MNNGKKIFFFGPLPPPTHGMAVVNAQMVALMQKHADVIVGNTSPGSLNRGLPYHLRKAIGVLAIILRLPAARLNGAHSLYGSPDDGWGGLWTLAILAVARALGMDVTLHHHSFRYLVQRSKLMRCITTIAGKSARHVVLGDRMAQKLAELYPDARNIVICENSVAMPVKPAAAYRSGPLTIGMLANLTAEKGVLDFVSVANAALDLGLAVEAKLAGPAADDRVAQAIAEIMTKHPGKIVSCGVVAGEAKETFFDDIDLFLFPTRYRTEAFPLVLMESLVRGVPVMAFDRGCIGQLSGQPGVTLVNHDSDFAAPALQMLQRLLVEGRPDRTAIASAALARNADNLVQLEKLAADICNDAGAHG
jgi:glycosyltransferase involved in cell wall biosynthesis